MQQPFAFSESGFLDSACHVDQLVCSTKSLLPWRVCCRAQRVWRGTQLSTAREACVTPTVCCSRCTPCPCFQGERGRAYALSIRKLQACLSPTVAWKWLSKSFPATSSTLLKHAHNNSDSFQPPFRGKSLCIHEEWELSS